MQEQSALQWKSASLYLKSCVLHPHTYMHTYIHTHIHTYRNNQHCSGKALHYTPRAAFCTRSCLISRIQASKATQGANSVHMCTYIHTHIKDIYIYIYIYTDRQILPYTSNSGIKNHTRCKLMHVYIHTQTYIHIYTYIQTLHYASI